MHGSVMRESLTQNAEIPRPAAQGAIQTTLIDTPLGPMLAGATDAGLCLLEFIEGRDLEAELRFYERKFRKSFAPGDHVYLELVRDELARYFSGALRQFSVPVDLYGTPFQLEVWKQLQSIPYGETRSYEEIAAAVRRPRATRAVGRANGTNPVSIIVPCHRVINKGGGLGGYGGGLDRKRYLLALERRSKV